MTLSPEQTTTLNRLRKAVFDWIEAEGTARSTLAGAVVVVDVLRTKAPFEKDDIFTKGGQLTGGRGVALRDTLAHYGEERKFLADGVTTRSTLKFEQLAISLDWGKTLSEWSAEAREEAACELADIFVHEIDTYFERQHISLDIDHQDSPVTWTEQLLIESKERSQGRVEQHLVGAKLETRLPYQDITEHPAFAADVQTGRTGDFVIGKIVFHVTAAPAPAVIEKCQDNLRVNLKPVLVVPRDRIERAKGLAGHYEGLEKRISFVAIEDFIATNIIELSGESDASFVDTEV